MKFWRRRRFLRWTAIAFATAAFTAPAAQAMPWVPEDVPAQGAPSTPAPPPQNPAASPSSSFAWRDAGIGAVGAISLLLMAGGTVLVVRGARREPVANPT